MKTLLLITFLILSISANAAKIVVIGDSLSAQDYITADAWPTYIQRAAPDSVVINLSHDAYTFYRVLTVPTYFSGKTVIQKAVDIKADIYLVSLGYNDLVTELDGRNVQQVVADYGEVFSQLRATGGQVYFVGMLASNMPTSYWSFWQAVYVPSNTFIVNYWKIEQMAGTSDGIHPTRLGSAMQSAYVLGNLSPILDLKLQTRFPWDDPEFLYNEYVTNGVWWQALFLNWK